MFLFLISTYEDSQKLDKAIGLLTEIVTAIRNDGAKGNTNCLI